MCADTKRDVNHKKKLLLIRQGPRKYWLGKLKKCVKLAKKTTAGTTQADLLTAMETIPNTL